MVFMGLLLNHVLPLLGVFYIITVVWKIAKGFSIKRWFF